MSETEYSLCMSQFKRESGQEKYDTGECILGMLKEAEQNASDRHWGYDCSDEAVWRYRISEMQRSLSLLRQTLFLVPQHQCHPMWSN